MLKARILTSVVILPLFLASLFYLSDIFWIIVLLAITTIGSREWSRLAQFSVKNTILFMLLTVFVGGELLFLLWDATQIDVYSSSFIAIYLSSLVFWAIAVPFILKQSVSIRHPIFWMLIGWIVLLPTCLALYQLRAISPWLLLGFMATIWISDTAAYFTGRSLGKHKLAPTISPNKTWEGVAGALVAVTVYAFVWTIWQPSSTFAFTLIPILLIMALLGIIGDLYESLVKRQAGVKDSGTLLPGHGGILDRIDALTSALPFAILTTILLHSSLS